MIVLNDLMMSQTSSVSDALHLLERRSEVTTSGDIALKFRSLYLDCGIEASTGGLLLTPYDGDQILIALPTSTYFAGINCTSGRSEKRRVQDLIDAVVSRDGIVVLKSGEAFRAINLERSALLKRPSRLDEEFVLFALSSVVNIHEFYESPFASLSNEITDCMPSQLRLNWAKLNQAAHGGQLKFRSIKQLCHEFFEWTGKPISIETARTALIHSGLYRSKRRPTATSKITV